MKITLYTILVDLTFWSKKDEHRNARAWATSTKLTKKDREDATKISVSKMV